MDHKNPIGWNQCKRIHHKEHKDAQSTHKDELTYHGLHILDFPLCVFVTLCLCGESRKPSVTAIIPTCHRQNRGDNLSIRTGLAERLEGAGIGATPAREARRRSERDEGAGEAKGFSLKESDRYVDNAGRKNQSS